MSSKIIIIIEENNFMMCIEQVNSIAIEKQITTAPQGTLYLEYILIPGVPDLLIFIYQFRTMYNEDIITAQIS